MFSLGVKLIDIQCQKVDLKTRVGDYQSDYSIDFLLK